MVRFYCPGCWNEFAEDVSPCPHCGLDIRAFWGSIDWLDKLILALRHPEPATPIRAAWLLGRSRDGRAVEPLIALVHETSDVYIARAAVRALGEIPDLRAQDFLRSLSDHPVSMIRDEAERLVQGRG
jgi:HEAT repeat protein